MVFLDEGIASGTSRRPTMEGETTKIIEDGDLGSQEKLG
jgi:hypothetical protein